MTYQNILRGVVALVVFVSSGMLLAQQDEEFQQLYEEYLEINQQLQQIQQQALQNEEVAAHYEAYSEFLDGKIKDIDPGAEELIDRRDQAINAIESAQAEGDIESAQQIQQEYEQVNQQLQPYMQEAMQDPEVQEQREQFEDALISEMENIDPESMPLLNRMEELSRQLDQMMQQQ